MRKCDLSYLVGKCEDFDENSNFFVVVVFVGGSIASIVASSRASLINGGVNAEGGDESVANLFVISIKPFNKKMSYKKNLSSIKKLLRRKKFFLLLWEGDILEVL